MPEQRCTATPARTWRKRSFADSVLQCDSIQQRNPAFESGRGIVAERAGQAVVYREHRVVDLERAEGNELLRRSEPSGRCCYERLRFIFCFSRANSFHVRIILEDARKIDTFPRQNAWPIRCRNPVIERGRLRLHCGRLLLRPCHGDNGRHARDCDPCAGAL